MRFTIPTATAVVVLWLPMGLWLPMLLAVAEPNVDPPVRSDQPYVASFEAQEAKFVRFVIHASSGGEPCVDELEDYGPDDETVNLALAKRGAKATASSCLPGYATHRVEHLNDGRYGNDRSWLAATSGDAWAQIELEQPTKVSDVAFSRDRNRQYSDRVPTKFEVQLSLDGHQWKSVRSAVGIRIVVPGRNAHIEPDHVVSFAENRLALIAQPPVKLRIGLVKSVSKT